MKCYLGLDRNASEGKNPDIEGKLQDVRRFERILVSYIEDNMREINITRSYEEVSFATRRGMLGRAGFDTTITTSDFAPAILNINYCKNYLDNNEGACEGCKLSIDDESETFEEVVNWKKIDVDPAIKLIKESLRTK